MTDRATVTPLAPVNSHETNPTRRQFVLGAAALATLGSLLPAREPKTRPRLAAVYDEAVF
jgi:hypothetical protein